MNINAKTVLITGGAKRVGAEIARSFARTGATVILHCRSSHAEAEELLRSLPGKGHRIVCADFSDSQSAKLLLDEAGHIDILVNNASMYTLSELHCGDETVDRMQLEVNFWAPLTLTRAFAAQHGLVEGAVINLLDQEIFASSAHGGVYALSRRILAEATMSLARELGPRNIRVNGVAPGPVLAPPGLEHLAMRKTLPTIPLRRKVELEDLCAAILFLAGNDSITGAILPVDCGQHL